MKPYFDKQITERPRHGSGEPNLKHGFSVHNPDPDKEYDHLPKRESIFSGRQRVRGQGKFEPKAFTDVLGPIEGFLRKNVGRPWDKIYSEICEALKPNTKQHIHALFTHLLPSVELHVEIWFRGKKKVPVRASDHRELYRTFYVNPKSGLLCWIGGKRHRYYHQDLNEQGYEWVKEPPDAAARRRWWNSKEPEYAPHTVLKISETLYLICKNGVWIQHVYSEHVERDRSNFSCVCHHSMIHHKDYKNHGASIPCTKCASCLKFKGELLSSSRTSYHLESTKVLSKKEKKNYVLT